MGKLLIISIEVINAEKMDHFISEGVHFIALSTGIPENILELQDNPSFRNALSGALLEIEDVVRSEQVQRVKIVVNRKGPQL